MVVSKRCKICAVLDPQNVPIAGEYFGKQIPEIILKISGVELDPRKTNDVLICHPCVIQLVHIDVVLEKVRNALQRLKKNVRDANLKTPLKKNVALNKSASESVEKQPLNLDGKRRINSDKEHGVVDDKGINTKKKIIRRKSMLVEEKILDAVDGNNQNGKAHISNAIFKSPGEKRKSISSNIEADKSLSLVSKPGDTGSVKRCKTKSTSEETPMDLTVEEQDTNIEACIKQVKEKIRNCILCKEIFHSKRTLRDHIETAHMGEKLKTCPDCFIEFRSQQKYDSHILSEKCRTVSHPCQHLNCSKQFKTLDEMKLHMKRKHSSNNDWEYE